MKKNLPVTGVETEYEHGTQLISSTDAKGKVTFVNHAFQEVSGFSADELVGQNHNVVRHPDMPPAAFDDLWSNLKAGRPWLGLVKNRCKNGNHYWVEAHVSPLFNDGQITGYESVRIVPERHHVHLAEELYKKLWKGKNPFKKAAWHSIRLRALLVFGLVQVMTLFVLLADLSEAARLTLIALMTAGGLTLLSLQLKPLTRLNSLARSITDNPVAQRAFTGRMDEAAAAEVALRMLRANNRTFLARLRNNSDALCHDTRQVTETEHEAAKGVEHQETRIEHITSSIHEMTSAINEISRLSTAAAQSATETDHQARAGRSIVERAVKAIHETSSELKSTEVLMEHLENDSQAIGDIVEVIRSITEQTNLLALNAAIEAARAGEQGRGFAVVADEVRSLAARTHEGTGRIQSMIEGLQSRAREAAIAIRRDGEKSSEVVNLANEAKDSLDDITRAVALIHDMNMQVAAAVEEQSMVSRVIAEDVRVVRELAETTKSKTNEVIEACKHLSTLSNNQQALVDSCHRLI